MNPFSRKSWQRRSTDPGRGPLDTPQDSLETLTDPKDRLIAELGRKSVEQAKLIAELQTEIDHLTERAYHDNLTGIYNRNKLDVVTQAIEDAGQSKDYLVFYLDLVNFKTINDYLGHESGDNALRLVAQSLSFSIRENDWAFRLGGDEFLVITTHAANDPNLSGYVNSIKSNLRKSVTLALDSLKATELYSNGISLGVSIGGAEKLPSESITDTIARADRDMQATKRIQHSTTHVAYRR